MTDFGSLWEFKDVLKFDSFLENYVVNFSGSLILEVAVIAKIRAVSRRLAIKIHLANDIMSHERLEAVVDRG